MDIYSKLRIGQQMKYLSLLMTLLVLMTSFSYAQSGAELEENSDGVYELSLYKSGIIEVDVPIEESRLPIRVLLICSYLKVISCMLLVKR